MQTGKAYLAYLQDLRRGNVVATSHVALQEQAHATHGLLEGIGGRLGCTTPGSIAAASDASAQPACGVLPQPQPANPQIRKKRRGCSQRVGCERRRQGKLYAGCGFEDASCGADVPPAPGAVGRVCCSSSRPAWAQTVAEAWKVRR